MSKTCNICYEDKNKNKFFNYKCCPNGSMCSTCMVKTLKVCNECCVFHFDCPFCKKKNYFDYKILIQADLLENSEKITSYDIIIVEIKEEY